MIMQIKADGSKQEEMPVESEGRQPVVMMKWSNVHGVKGHSQYLYESQHNLLGKAWSHT